MKTRKIIGIICILLGVSVIVGIFAFNTNKKETIEQENLKIIEEFEAAQETTVPNNEGEDEYHPYRVSTGKQIDGILRIEKIDLELPVFTELTTANMNLSVCRVPNTGAPDCNNYCILGHYMRIEGVILNRLNEVEKGDIITMTTTDTFYTYEVSDIIVRKGVDYDLFKDTEEKQITILTCDYSIKDGRRFVIGKLISES